MGKYDDIIDLPHHVSMKHPHMSLMDRAAQFSPFAALSGHADAIAETARLTDQQIELSEEQKAVIDGKLQYFLEQGHPKVSIVYFEPDTRKQGGAYLSMTGTLKRIDNVGRLIILDGGSSVPIDSIYNIELTPMESGQ